jgi:hypothetical protein
MKCDDESGIDDQDVLHEVYFAASWCEPYIMVYIIQQFVFSLHDLSNDDLVYVM